MKLIPLGGAEEVGATCTLVEIGGHKIMVDAGIRINQPDPLPDLSRITDFGGIEAILVTHAHTDHTGALPVVHRAYPSAPIFATPGTQALVNVLYNDALNIMKSRYEHDRELPLYNKDLVQSLFTRMQSVQLGQTVKLFGGDVAATFFPAGHILGAACIGLQAANGESAFISGDISLTPQLTVGGMLPPVSVDRKFRPQVVMVESTYGNRLHANRANEERRLVETVAHIVEQGGRVLIPAFAVGRAQEVLLILAKAMSRKQIAPFPVWVDGMVRSVCSVYTQHPYDLATAIRKQIVQRGNPFFGETAAKEADFVSINTPDERQKLAEGKTPGCIVASSGMLSGGPSSFYARYIVNEADSAIFITGYQDEESPGRALLALAEATNPADRVLKLEGESVPVVCHVGKYSLSAHADAGEIAGLIEQLQPQETVLVHGAGGAREALSDLLTQGRQERRTYLPSAGDELTFVSRKAKKMLPKIPASTVIAVSVEELPRPLIPTNPTELLGLRARIEERFGEKSAQSRAFTLQEVAQFWLEASAAGAEGLGLNAEEYTQFRNLLTQPQSGFVLDARRPFLYRLAKASAIEKAAKPAPAEQFPLEQNLALAVVEKLLPSATVKELYRRGAINPEHKFVLYFYFPELAAEKYKTELEEIAKQTGWAVELNPEAHHGALGEVVQKLAGQAGLRIVKGPSIHRETREVKATAEKIEQSNQNLADLIQKLAAAFTVETKWSLLLTVPGGEVVQAAPPVQLGEGVARMEINTAFVKIDQSLAQIGLKPFRKSLKQGMDGQFIELSFVTAQMGERYRATLDDLQTQIGWLLRINPEPHHQALQQVAADLLRESGVSSRYVVKGFSLHRDRNELAVKFGSIPGEEVDKTTLQTRFKEQTGWSLAL